MNYIRLFFFVFVLPFLLISCQKEDIIFSTNYLDFNGYIVGNIIPVKYTTHKKSYKKQKIHGTIKGYFFRGEIQNKKINRNCILMALPHESYIQTFEGILELKNQENLLKEFKGIIIVYLEDGRTFNFGGEFDRGKWSREVKKSKNKGNIRIPYSCDQYVVEINYYTDWYVNGVYTDTQHTGVFYEYYEVCNSNHNTPSLGGGSYHTNSYNSQYIDNERPDGADCESWQYENMNGTWQECGVSNISLKVFYTNPNDNRRYFYAHTITRTLYFGVPALTYDNIQVSSGFAAQMSAEAYQEAFRRIHLEHRYNSRPSSLVIEDKLKRYCEEELKLLIPGARVSFSPNYPNAPINSFQTVLFGTGNCL